MKVRRTEPQQRRLKELATKAEFDIDYNAGDVGKSATILCAAGPIVIGQLLKCFGHAQLTVLPSPNTGTD